MNHDLQDDHEGNDLGLPPDALMVRDHPDRQVWLSRAERVVWRVGFPGGSDAQTGPTDIETAHRLGHQLAAIGLNFLQPLEAEPKRRGNLVISSWPLHPTIEETGWQADEPAALGAALAAWADATVPRLRELDIPGYVGERISWAFHHGGDVAEAAEGIQEWLEGVEANFPWQELLAERGLVHGDPNLGNMVRREGRLEFIDLDTVSVGPVGFDLSVMNYYVDRFNVNYPATKVLDGYRAIRGFPSDRLEGLCRWKEVSALTQLLVRATPRDLDELRRRVPDLRYRWRNMVGTPMGITLR